MWLSLARRCLVLQCSHGVTRVLFDHCARSSEATQPPTAPTPPTPPTTPAAAATAAATATAQTLWSEDYYPCQDSSTGLFHQHGATWSDNSVNCATFRCMNGTVSLVGFFCLSPDREPEPPGPEAPAPEAPAPEAPAPDFPASFPVPELPASFPVPEFPAPEPEAPEPAVPEISVVTRPPVTVPPLAPGPVPPLAPRPSSPDGGPGEVGSSCVDDYGQVQASGNAWTVPARPCLRFRCQDGIIHPSNVTCPPAPPGCTALPVLPDSCCPSHICPEGPRDCSYDGRTYSSGDVFADDRLHPCQKKRCDDGLVVSLSPPTVCTAVYCAEPYWPEGSCCKTCPGQWRAMCRASRVRMVAKCARNGPVFGILLRSVLSQALLTHP